MQYSNKVHILQIQCSYIERSRKNNLEFLCIDLRNYILVKTSAYKVESKQVVEQLIAVTSQ